MIMKVLVTNLAGVKTEDGRDITHYAKAGSRWPMVVGKSKSVDYYPFPFWLAYTSALLKRDTPAQVKGLDGVVLDMEADQYLQEVEKFQPDLVITELTTIALKDDLKTLQTIHEKTGARIALAGSYPAACGDELLRENSFIDFVFRKEYEFTAKELVNALIENKSLDGLLGITFRKGNDIVRNGDRPLIIKLDELPFPDREDFPASLYPDFTLYSPCIDLIASRGCPGGCTYCQERHVMYNSGLYRPRDVKRIVDEMELCKEKYYARQFYFDDQSFTINQKFTQALCREIIDRKINIPWTCMGDAFGTTRETLELMAKSGCIGMKFGVESANTKILKGIGKPLDPNRALQVVKWCKEFGIRTHATFIVGLPNSTKQDTINDMNYFDEMQPFTAQVAIATPYPGTPFYAWAKKNGYLVTEDFTKYDGMGQSVVSYPDFPKEEIEMVFKKFFKKVSRQKLKHFIFAPLSSLSIMKEIAQKKGIISLGRSVFTVVKRAI
ncbi:MAG: hypothetical protein A2328_06510 [Bdellovibrionales bacterium RIFOXYB2_FULL_36_6]|nr:MAG: hypothetical protein A2328_06510 [Bdellovibrionales bacterium RIFOXYB2_FULL_36_6]